MAVAVTTTNSNARREKTRFMFQIACNMQAF